MKNIPFDYKVEPQFGHKLSDKELDIFEPYHEQYTYNDEIVSLIVEKYKLDENFGLSRWVYLSRTQLRDRKLTKDGFLKLTTDVLATLRDTKLLELRLSSIMGTKIVKCRVVDGRYSLPPRARTKGYDLHRLFGEYIRVIN